jgi:hypothetical protein
VVLGIAQCWYQQCLLTLGGNLLPHTVTALDVGMMLQRDPVQSTPCRMPSKNTANITVTVDSKCLHCLTLYLSSCSLFTEDWCPVLSRSTLCRPITHYHSSHTVLLRNISVTQTAPRFLKQKCIKHTKCFFAYIIQRDTARVCPAINWFIRGFRREIRKTWQIITDL